MELKVYDIYEQMLKEHHLLVAGATGSGKSVVINGLIYNAIFDSPETTQLVLIDPKMVDLYKFRNLPHVTRYACDMDDMIAALADAVDLMMRRYRAMHEREIEKWDGGDVYVIIDELADLMQTAKKRVEPLLQRLVQLGRAAKVHVVAATQCVLVSVLPTPIRTNFTATVGLKVRNKRESKLILDEEGAETLPRYGKAKYKHDIYCDTVTIPMYDSDTVKYLIDYWTKPRRATA